MQEAKQLKNRNLAPWTGGDEMFIKSDKYYTMNELEQFLDDTNTFEVIYKKEKECKYANTPCAFDIETSSFYNNGNKQGIMYVWQFSISGLVIVGRTWDEFKQFTRALMFYHGLGIGERHMIVYVHNLAYEFGFIARRFGWSDMFFKDIRKPLYLISDMGLEFRCSYALSNLSLEDCGKSLTKYLVEKKIGQLDYSRIRTPKTPLTDDEMEYCVNDVKVVCAYVQELIEQEGDITKLPYTKTAFARNYTRNHTLYDGSGKRKKYNKEYRNLIKSLTLTPETYNFARDVFQGGFTHANRINAFKTHENVHSIDFTSSYPYVMVSSSFPMSSPVKVDNCSFKDLKKLEKKYHTMFEIAFTDFQLKDESPDAYISQSKCGVLLGEYDETGCLINPVIINNGRVEYAKYVTTKITDVDLKIIKKYYDWNDVKVRNVYKMVKDYLPRQFVLVILTLYSDKTTLKGVDGKENFYQVAKGLLNSLYGMSVTSAINDEIECNFNENGYEFVKTPANAEEEIKRYNNSKTRFLYYMWGLWITSWARYNLLMSIYQFGADYIYSDTDSIKFLNYERHKDFIENYNESVKKRLVKIADYYNIELEKFNPVTVDGEIKTLGVWELETSGKKIYTRFKTIGRKRYILEQKGEIKLTVSGINKKTGAAFFKTFDNPFDAFKENVIVPKEYAGRQVSTYIDNAYSGIVTDYLGNAYEYHELSGIHMEPTTYEFSVSASYIDLVRGNREMSMYK